MIQCSSLLQDSSHYTEINYIRMWLAKRPFNQELSTHHNLYIFNKLTGLGKIVYKLDQGSEEALLRNWLGLQPDQRLKAQRKLRASA